MSVHIVTAVNIICFLSLVAPSFSLWDPLPAHELETAPGMLVENLADKEQDILPARPIQRHAKFSRLKKRNQYDSLLATQHSFEHSVTTLPIDLVYCWQGPVCADHSDQALASDHNRGCDHGEMIYSLKSVAEYAPWVNKIFILVNGVHPEWAGKELTHKVQMVDRCTLFQDQQDCPTVNTHACQAVMHHIPSLSEHFLYMEDDLFFTKEVTPSDFFEDIRRPVIFSQDVSLTYMYTKPYIKLSGPVVPPEEMPSKRLSFRPHIPMPMLKSFALALEQKYPAWYAFVRSHKRRWQCCHDSGTVDTKSLDEDFTGVYPAELLRLHIGVWRPYKDAYCEVNNISGLWCFNIKVMFSTFSNGNNANDWCWRAMKIALDVNFWMHHYHQPLGFIVLLLGCAMILRYAWPIVLKKNALRI